MPSKNAPTLPLLFSMIRYGSSSKSSWRIVGLSEESSGSITRDKRAAGAGRCQSRAARGSPHERPRAPDDACDQPPLRARATGGDLGVLPTGETSGGRATGGVSDAVSCVPAPLVNALGGGATGVVSLTLPP